MTINALSQLPALDRTVYASKSAGTFDVYARRWVLSYSKPKGLNIPDFDEFPPEQKETLLRVLAERANKYQEGSIKAEISVLRGFIRHFSDSDDFCEYGIDVEHLLIWFASSAHDEYKRNLRRLVLDAIELGYGAAFEEGVETLCEQYQTKRLRLHPDRFEASRSFAESERKQVFYQMARESQLGRIPDSVRVPATLILITGKRPIQTAHSKFMDFSVEDISLAEGDQRKGIRYNVPVAKQKGQRFRTAFNSMPVSSSFEIWDDLEAMRTAHIERLNQLLEVQLTEEQSLLLPIYIPVDDEDIIQRFGEAKRSGLDLNDFLRSDRLHVTAYSVSASIIKLNDYLTIVSEYTGRLLRINAKRFRHTRATNLALSGESIDVIADALDHSSRESARTYVDNLPARAVKIGSQVEKTLGVIAKIFSGITVENPDQVIKLFTKNGTHNVGTCGMEAFCSENYPIACYECELFNPNPFGNHAAVQEYVENKLQEAQENGDSRLIENWHTILLAVLERRYIADQQRLQMLNEAPQILSFKNEKPSDE
jgi:integrase